jgi:lipoyl synthase
VGLGESRAEVLEALAALRQHRVQVLTLGQYLRPSQRHLPVVRYWHPDEFAALARDAYQLGFEHVAAGPLVRSSYHADEHVRQEQPGRGPLADRAGTPDRARRPAADLAQDGLAEAASA